MDHVKNVNKLSFIIPCYNEQGIILNSINKLNDYMEENIDIQYEIIVVDDGSSDKTYDVALDANAKNTTVLKLQENQGKGAAVKHGLSASTGDVMLFMDADMATDLHAINLVIKQHNNGFDFVVGSRSHRKSSVLERQPLHRRIIGACCRRVTSLVLGISPTDTQCGFKSVSRRFAEHIIKHQTTSGWAFDAEWFVLSAHEGFAMIEIPVVWSNGEKTSVSPVLSSIQFIIGLYNIKKEYKKKTA